MDVAEIGLVSLDVQQMSMFTKRVHSTRNRKW